MKKEIWLSMVTIIGVGVLSTASQATIILDPSAQQLTENNYRSFNLTAWAGQYITTSNPYIASVDLRIFNGVIDDTTVLNIYGSDTTNGDPDDVTLTLLASKTVVFTSNDNTISSRYDFEGIGGVDVSAYQGGGHRIFLEFSVSNVVGGAGELGSFVPGPYSGFLYTSTDGGASWGTDVHNLGFSVRTSDTFIPEPATLGLLALGSLGLIRSRRR